MGREAHSVPLVFIRASFTLTFSSGTFPLLVATAVYLSVSPRFTLPSPSVSPCAGGAIVRVKSGDATSSAVTVTATLPAVTPS